MAEDLGALVAKLQADVSDLKKGLRESRDDLRSFKDMAADAGAKVKQALSFVGVAVGIYEIASALKEFARDAAMVGARTETLAVGMELIGKNAGLSRGTLDYYVQQLKQLGITTQEAMNAVTRFVVSGLPLDKIEQLADVARNQAALVGKNTSEAFNDILTGITTQQPEILRKYLLNIGLLSNVLKSAMKPGMTADDIDPLTRSMMVLNATLDVGKRAAGAYEAMMQTVGKQTTSLARYAEEAKNSLWALFGPVMQEIVEQTASAWKELKTWADANQDSLKGWGEGVADFIKRKIELLAIIGKFINQAKELIFEAGKFYIFYKAAGWAISLTLALEAAVPAIIGASAAASASVAGWVALAGGIKAAVIALAAYGAYQTVKKPASFDQMSREESALLGEAGVLALPKETADDFRTYEEPLPSGVLGYKSPAERQREMDAANKKAIADSRKNAGGGGKAGGGKGAGKEAADNLLAPMLAMFKVKREAELQDAQNSLDLLKSSNDKKRAELEKSLAEGLVDGRTYYQGLQELQQAETTAALSMIDRKKAAQQKAYEESLTQLDADTKLSEEAKGIARQKLEAENIKALAKLDTEAAQARLDGEVKITNELKRQVEIRKQYQQKTEDLNLETKQLLGAITEQESKLQKLVLDWQRAKEEAIKAGAGPEYLAALDANLGAKQFDVKYGDALKNVSSEFSSGVLNIVNGIRQGTFDISNALIEMFNNIMMAALKPGFDALGDALSSAVTWLLSSLSQALGGPSFSSAGASGGGGDYSYLTGMVGALKIPGQALAGGGIAYGPTLAMIAEAGEAEVVSPLSDLKNLLNPQSVNVIVNNNAPRTQASAESQPNGDIVVTIEPLMAKAYALRGTFFKMVNSGREATKR